MLTLALAPALTLTLSRQPPRPVAQVVSPPEASAGGDPAAGGKAAQPVTSAVKRGEVFFAAHCRPTHGRAHGLAPKGVSQGRYGQIWADIEIAPTGMTQPQPEPEPEP